MGALTSILLEIAPTLARAVAGPLGSKVVDIVADALGTSSDPDAVAQKIKEDPETAKRTLAYLESAMQAEIKRLDVQGTNMQLFYEAYRDDKKRGGFWSWPRPVAAWLALSYAASVSVILVRDLWSRSYELIAHLDLLIYWAVPMMALAGIWFFGRSQERAALGKVIGAPDGSQTSWGEIVKRTLSRALPGK